MKKKELIDAAVIFLAGASNAPPEIRTVNDPRVINKFLSLSFDTYFNKSTTIKDDLADEMGISSWRYDAFTKPYYLPILKDERRNKFYSVIPVDIFSANNNQAIRMVCYAKEESTVFFPRRTTDNFLMDGLDSNIMGGIFYILEGNKLMYSGDIDGCLEEVMVKLAVKFEQMEDDDFILIPDGDSMSIFQTMLQIMQGKMATDNTDDNIGIQNTK